MEENQTEAQATQVVEPKPAPATDLVDTYRSQRDKAIRQAHAYSTMLKAHGIDTSNVTEAALQQITIHAGAPDSPFEYNPPKISIPAPAAKPRPKTAEQPTLEDVKTWDEDKIADNWDTVKQLMKKGGK